MWRPAFPFVEQRPARVHGFVRRFWQGSTDHRGVPGSPGRVVTLVARAGAPCWGMAYRVAPEERDAVLARLDHREKGGYERHELELEWAAERRGRSAEPSSRGLVYVAGPRNPNYLGPAPVAEVVEQVLRSRGPSGSNVEYVLQLADALRTLCPALDADEEETLAIAERVRAAAGGAGRGPSG